MYDKKKVEINDEETEYFDIDFETNLINMLNNLKSQDTISDYSVQVEPQSFEITFSLSDKK